MLVDQQNRNVLALRSEAIEGGLDGGIIRLAVYDKKVLL